MSRFRFPNSIKVGVIGYGSTFNMSKIHLQDMRKAGMTPTAVAEIDPERLKVAEQDFPGIETYTSVANMLKRSAVNLVVIVTPHNTHAKLAMQCLRGNRHVICEKPLAITTAQCDRMIAQAKRHRCMVTTYHNRHWDGNVLQSLKTIRSGAIGDVYRIDAIMGGYGKPGDWWRSSKSISGGIVYDWGVHLTEYALQIIDSEMVEITGFAHRGFWDCKSRWKTDINEDEVSAVVRFANGTRFTLTITSIDADTPWEWMRVAGNKGVYRFNHSTWESIVHRNDRRITTRGSNPPDQWHRFYQNVAAHLLKGEPLVITPEWARRPIHIFDLVDRSAAKGTAIRTKYR